MKKLHFRTLFPAIIFSLCILELSFGLLISFRVVWWFYAYFIFFLFSLKSLTTPSTNSIKINRSIVILYLLCATIYLFHHFLSSYELFEVSASGAYNILWWTVFGILIVWQIKDNIIDYQLFWRYTYVIVFYGTVVASAFGILKYIHVLNGNVISSYFYDDSLIFGSSLSTDYNLYSIGLLIGAIFSFQVRQWNKGKLFSVFYLVCLSVIYLSSLISGSRRGFLLTIVVVFLGFFYKGVINGRWRRNITALSIVLISTFLLLGIFWGTFIQLMENSGLIDSSIARIFSIKEDFSGENNRTVRFEWAYNKFSNLPINNMILGSGFDYLSEMGRAFGDSSEDHPHNFVLSTLLYGGIIGLILLIVLLYRMLSNTFSTNKPFFFALVILLFFSLSSANSLFSFRIFPTMVLLSSVQIVQFRKSTAFR